MSKKDKISQDLGLTEEKRAIFDELSKFIDANIAQQMAADGYNLTNLSNLVMPEELMARYGLSKEEAQKIIDDAAPKSVKIKRIQEANEDLPDIAA